MFYFSIFYLSYKLDPFQKENGEIILDSSSITQEAKRFYEKLYRSHENDVVNTDIGNTATPTVPQEEISDSLEGPITLHQALSALKQIKNDKSRGLDGYTVDLFGSGHIYYDSLY